jgi:hypothetical protein
VRFAIYGPFTVPRQSAGLISRDYRAKREFWNEIEDSEAGLPDACGCYILAIRGMPWYIGLAEKRAFRHECLALHKIVKYDDALRTAGVIPSFS